MKREKAIIVRLTEEEHARLSAKAEEVGLSISAYIRSRAVYDDPLLRVHEEALEKLKKAKEPLS